MSSAWTWDQKVSLIPIFFKENREYLLQRNANHSWLAKCNDGPTLASWRKTNMRNRVLGFSFAVLMLGCAAQVWADPTMELVLDDGLGDVVTVDVNGGLASVTYGACPNGCAATPFTTGDHKSLVALATIGQFEINTTGKGGLALFSPTLEDLNQINATAFGRER